METFNPALSLYRRLGFEHIDSNGVYTATNTAGSSPTQNFTLTVNQAPAITSANSATFAPGLTGQTFTVTTTGFPTSSITQTGTLPGGVTFTDNGNNTATIAGTPAAGTQAGSPYPWTITAANGVPPNAMQAFTFNVVCPTITVSGTIPDLMLNQVMVVKYGEPETGHADDADHDRRRGRRRDAGRSTSMSSRRSRNGGTASTTSLILS